MLASIRSYLYQIHWRFGLPANNWVNEVAFYLFVLLIGLNLWYFAAQCSAGGARIVRVANAGVLALGSMFVLLTFHTGDKNYLYPVLNGILSLHDLGSYLSLTLFFQPPFLAVWLFAYGMLYYALVRTNREHLAIYFTSVFAVVYTAFFLRDLINLQHELLIADCLGITCLLIGARSVRPPGWLWLIQPVLWGVFFLLLFALPKNIDLSQEFLMLSGWCLVLLAGVSALAWRRKFLGTWLRFSPFVIVTLLLLTNINYDNADNLRNLLCLGLTLPRYFLGEFAVTFVLLVAAILYRRLLPKSSLGWLDAINLLLIVLAVADLRLTQIMGVRLDWHTIEFGDDLKMVWRLSRPFLPGLVIGLIIISALYALLVGLWQRADSKKTLRVDSGGSFLLASFLLLGIAGHWFAPHDKAEGQSVLLLAQTSPLFAELISPVMDGKKFIATTRELGMESMLQPPPAEPARAERDLNVVLIFQESSYNRYLSLFGGREETQPLLSKYKDRMELFPNFFSSFAASMWARFAAFTGLYPVRDLKYFTAQRVPVKSVFEVLHQNGYDCSLFYSSFFDYTGFRDFLARRGLDEMYDADTMPGERKTPGVSWGLKEEETAGAIREQIKNYAAQKKKFFLTYVPAAPHNPFDGTPDQFRKYKLVKVGDYTPSYLNELLYMDWVITSILDELKDTGMLDNTLVVITDDHGELLGENEGPIGHGWAVTPELANVPLIIIDPDKRGYHINDTVGSQVDLLPTILDLLGIPVPADQLYQGQSLYSGVAPSKHRIYLNSLQQFGIIKDRQIFCGDRETLSQAGSNNVASSAYTIVNLGARTTFLTNQPPDDFMPNIAEFDAFQNNFLVNYAQYCKMFRTAPTNEPSLSQK